MNWAIGDCCWKSCCKSCCSCKCCFQLSPSLPRPKGLEEQPTWHIEKLLSFRHESRITESKSCINTKIFIWQSLDWQPPPTHVAVLVSLLCLSSWRYLKLSHNGTAVDCRFTSGLRSCVLIALLTVDTSFSQPSGRPPRCTSTTLCSIWGKGTSFDGLGKCVPDGPWPN